MSGKWKYSHENRVWKSLGSFRDSRGWLWNAVPENRGKIIPRDLGKRFRRALYHFGFAGHQMLFLLLGGICFQGGILTFPPPLLPFFCRSIQGTSWLLQGFQIFFFPRCNLLKILLPFGILGCFRFPWRIRSLVELRLFL